MGTRTAESSRFRSHKCPVDRAVRYTLDNPPPADPPVGLASGYGIWRVMHQVWLDHHPIDTPSGRRCLEPACRRPWGEDGCWGHRAAADVLTHMHRYPDGVGLVGYHPMRQILLDGPPGLTRGPSS